MTTRKSPSPDLTAAFVQAAYDAIRAEYGGAMIDAAREEAHESRTPDWTDAFVQAAYDADRAEYDRAMIDAAREEAHEAHGGDEEPDREDCHICREAFEEFVCFGVSS